MAVITPPLFQTVDSFYTGADLGRPYSDFISEGVTTSGGLAVSERGAGANMSVDVAAGVAWIQGDDSTIQPCYRVYNDATVNLVISAADATNPRIDRVIAEVRDAAFSGVSTDWRLRVITGTPAGSPSAPALPNNAISLATISVPALDTTIGTAQITDTRPRAQLGAELGPTVVTSLPANPYDGQEIEYVADSTNGVVWRFRYRAASGSSYKWEFVGGPPLVTEVSTSQTTTSASYTDLATAGPTVTVPLAGDYDVRFGCKSSGTIATAVQNMAIKRGSASAADADAIDLQPAGNNYLCAGPGSRLIRMTGLAASDALKAQYKTNNGTATFEKRWVEVTPVRIG